MSIYVVSDFAVFDGIVEDDFEFIDLPGEVFFLFFTKAWVMAQGIDEEGEIVDRYEGQVIHADGIDDFLDIFDVGFDEFCQGDIFIDIAHSDDAEVFIDNGLEQFLFIQKVMIERAFGKSDGLADIADGNGLIAFLQEEFVSLVYDIIFRVGHNAY